jgi:hypothetical protein
MNDTIAEYTAEVDRLSREWDRLKARLKTAKNAERKSLQHQRVTVQSGRGELRRVIEYLQSYDRLRTRGADEWFDDSRD